jgi:hypothetical protein
MISGVRAPGLPAILVRTRPADGARHIVNLADAIEVVTSQDASQPGTAAPRQAG